MEVYVRYKGRRSDELKSYKAPYMRGGPYDFSKGPSKMDEKDADNLIARNPVAFVIVKNATPVAAAATPATPATPAAATPGK